VGQGVGDDRVVHDGLCDRFELAPHGRPPGLLDHLGGEPDTLDLHRRDRVAGLAVGDERGQPLGETLLREAGEPAEGERWLVQREPGDPRPGDCGLQLQDRTGGEPEYRGLATLGRDDCV
jgi:hypothetical protein